MAFPTSPSEGQEYTNALGTVYKYTNVGNDDKWYIISAPINLDEIEDVVITTPGDNEGLFYDISSGDWINQTPAEAELEPAFSKNNAFNKNFGSITGTVTQGDDSRLQDALKIQGKTVDDADIGNGKILKYNSGSGNLEYEIDDTGAGFAPPIGFIAMFSGSWTDDSTIPGWYKCDGNNGTVNLVDKFVRGGATSGATGGSDDAVIVQHSHCIEVQNQTRGTGGPINDLILDGGSCIGGRIGNAGVSGVNANIPAYYTLIFIQRIS